MLKSFAFACALAVAAVSFQASSADARPRFHRGHVGAGIAAGLIGAAILGTAAAASARTCYIERRAVYNRYGDYLGTRRYRVCD